MKLLKSKLLGITQPILIPLMKKSTQCRDCAKIYNIYLKKKILIIILYGRNNFLSRFYSVNSVHENLKIIQYDH